MRIEHNDATIETKDFHGTVSLSVDGTTVTLAKESPFAKKQPAKPWYMSGTFHRPPPNESVELVGLVTDEDKDMKFYVRRVFPNNGGYFKGRYFGKGGLPLYLYQSTCSTVHDYVRAPDREAAKRKISKNHAGATFYK